MQPGHAQAPLQAPHSINAFGELSTGVRESSERESTQQRESKYLDLDLVANILRSFFRTDLVGPSVGSADALSVRHADPLHQ